MEVNFYPIFIIEIFEFFRYCISDIVYISRYFGREVSHKGKLQFGKDIMSKHTIVGSGSLMPESFYLRKMEQTCLYEDPDLLNNHYRSTLKDLRPDAPFFESDQPRYNNYSEDRLNLRYHGKRVPTEPYLPEGTFLDFQFLEKDPRGIALEPDFSKYRTQQEYRGRYIKHGNDEDNSVPSSGWHPTHVVRDIKGQFYNMKERIKIFDESFDGRHNGGVYVNKLHTSGVCLQDNDERKPIMRDEMCYNRANVINDLSNDTSTGWRRTTDHRFQVAKYGQIRGNAPLETSNWNKNRSNAKIDHDINLSWKDQNVSKTMVLKMVDMANKKRNDINSGRTVYLNESEDNQMGRSRKLTPQDLIQIRTNVDKSQVDAPHTTLNGQVVNYRQAHPQLDTTRASRIIMDPTIVDFMLSVNRKMPKHELNDLREEIEQTGETFQILVENGNRIGTQEYGNEMLWESEADYIKGESVKIANYAKLGYQLAPVGQNIQDMSFEQYTKNSKEGGQRRGAQTNDLYNMEVLDYDNKFGRDIDAVKQIGHMGNKYVRHLTDYEGTNNTLAGLESANTR
jgi:hypothetical protein